MEKREKENQKISHNAPEYSKGPRTHRQQEGQATETERHDPTTVIKP